MSESICPISGELPKEEKWNYLTHLFGLILSLIGGAFLIIYTSQLGDYLSLISCSIYGMTLVILYASSTFYHKCEHLERKHTFRVLDHVCIYLFIAGSYTPFTLGPLIHYHGWYLLGIEWGVALIGIAFKIWAINRFQFISTLVYLGMGWLVVFNFSVLMEQLSATSIILLISGGLAYTLGVIFFLWTRLLFNHAIWHLFVLGGSICHYFSILDMIQYHGK